MSKKTKAAKLKAAKKPARKRTTTRRARRPNPLKAAPRSTTPRLFADPIFLHHLAGCIFRTLELYPPKPGSPGPFNPADFIKPEGLAGTVNRESPDTPQGPEAKE